MKRKSRNQFLIFIALIAVGVFATMGMMASREDIKTEAAPEVLTKVKVVPVKYKPLQFQMDYTGRVLSSQIVMLSSEVTGKLKAGEVNFKNGESFRKGDLLLRVEDDRMQASMRALKSGFLSNLAQILPDLKIDFAEAYPKWNKFFNQISLDRDLPELPKIDSEKERIYISSRNIMTQYYDIVQQQIQLAKHNIYADFDGFIFSTQMEVGAIAGMSSPLAQLIRADFLEIEVPVKQQDIKWLSEGMKCRVKKSDGEMLNASVSRIAGFMNQTTQMISVYVKVNAQQQSIYQGEYLEVEFDIEKNEQVFVLNREAMDEKHQVYGVEEGRLLIEDAELVYMGEDTVYLKGLAEDILLVNESVLNPVVGDSVEVIKK